MATTTTPLMGLELPITGSEPGPQWADDINSAFDKVDAHDHSNGNGSLISPTGLNIDTELSMGSNDLIDARSVRLDNQGSSLSGASDKNCVNVVNGDLVFNNGSGVAVQITAGNAINAASIGAIGGDYATSGASESYSSITKTFSFTQSSGKTAKIAVGDIQLYENAVGAQPITLKSPTSLASAYSLTMPAALPIEQSVVEISTGGVLTAVPATYLSPVGAILEYAGSSAPTGWLLCDGSAVSRTTYAALFAVLGTVYGVGDGSTTFNVPDHRGRTAIGAGTGSGLTNRVLGATGGEESHALSTSELASHSHGITDPGHSHFVIKVPGISGVSTDKITPVVDSSTSDLNTASSSTGITVNSAGSGTAHNTMQPYVVTNFIIKT